MKLALETLFCFLKSYLQSFVMMMMMITFFRHIILSLIFHLYMHSSTKNLKLFEKYKWVLLTGNNKNLEFKTKKGLFTLSRAWEISNEQKELCMQLKPMVDVK